MNNSQSFQLDSRLAADCIELGLLIGSSKDTNSVLLLMNNADIPWFVIVPTGISVIDIDELPELQQIQMLKNMNRLSAFLKQQYQVDKINFASIGNIVQQMHFHLVARTKQDPAWPGVVWGIKAENKVTQEQVEGLKCQLVENVQNFKMSHSYNLLEK